MKKYAKISLLVLLGLLVIIQFFRIEQNNPPITEEEQFSKVESVPANVLSIFQRACYDCHSNETQWPWYADVAPVSWIVGDHVQEAREEMNFSEWGSFSLEKRDHKLEEIIEEVSEGEMPERAYAAWHPEALISPADTSIMFSWIRTKRRELSKEME